MTENAQKFVMQGVRHHITATSLRWKDWEHWIKTSERKDSGIGRRGIHFQEQKPEEDGLQIKSRLNEIRGSKHIGQQTLKSLMPCLGIIEQRLQHAAKPKHTRFDHQPSVKDQNLLSLTSAFTDGIFVATWTQVLSAHALSARNAPSFKGERSSEVDLQHVERRYGLGSGKCCRHGF